MRYLKLPILGDRVYGYEDKKFPGISLMLHSKSLEITLPGESQPRLFSSQIPERFKEVIEKLNQLQ
jgi:23S rRNA pseudouridine1911/1915/1917 synthase